MKYFINEYLPLSYIATNNIVNYLHRYVSTKMATTL